MFYYWVNSKNSKSNPGFEFDEEGKPINNTFAVRKGDGKGVIELDCSEACTQTLHVMASKHGFADSAEVVQTFTVHNLAKPAVNFAKASGTVEIIPNPLFDESFEGSTREMNEKEATEGKVLYSWEGPVDLGPSGSRNDWEYWTRGDNIAVPLDKCKKAGELTLYLLSVQAGSVPIESEHLIKIDTAVLPTFEPKLEKGCATMLGINVGDIPDNTTVEYAWSSSPSATPNDSDLDWKPLNKGKPSIEISEEQGHDPDKAEFMDAEPDSLSGVMFFARAKHNGHAPGAIVNPNPLTLPNPYTIGYAADLHHMFNEATGELLLKVPDDPKTRFFYSFDPDPSAKVSLLNATTGENVIEYTDKMFNGTENPTKVADGDNTKYVAFLKKHKKAFRIKLQPHMFSNTGKVNFSYITTRAGVNCNPGGEEIKIEPTKLPKEVDIKFDSLEGKVVIKTEPHVTYVYSFDKECFEMWSSNTKLEEVDMGIEYNGDSIQLDPVTQLQKAGIHELYIRATQPGRTPTCGSYDCVINIKESEEVTFQQDEDTGVTITCTLARDNDGLTLPGTLFYSWDDQKAIANKIAKGTSTWAEISSTFIFGHTPEEDDILVYTGPFKLGERHLQNNNSETLYYKYIEQGKSPVHGIVEVKIKESEKMTFQQDEATGAMTCTLAGDNNGQPLKGKLFYSWDGAIPIDFIFKDGPKQDVLVNHTPLSDANTIELGDHLLENNNNETLYYKYIEEGKSPVHGTYEVIIKDAIPDVNAFNAKIFRHDADTFVVGDLNTFTFNDDIAKDNRVATDEKCKLYATTGSKPSTWTEEHDITKSTSVIPGYLMSPEVKYIQNGYNAVTVHWRVECPFRAPTEGSQTWMQIPKITLKVCAVLQHHEAFTVQLVYVLVLF